MNPSRIFILRPVATSLLTAGLLLVGMVAYFQLPISALPQVDYPTIQIVTFYPGASPDVMASSVTTPLERQFGQLPGLKQMTSTSSSGASKVTLQFALDLSIDVAEQQVQAAINAAATNLPRDLPSPPTYSKVNPADAPVLTLALTSDTLPLSRVEDLAETNLAQKISQLPGVGLVSISGGQKPAVRVQADPDKLASYGLSLEDLRAVLAQANVDQAKGNLEGPRQSFTIGANDQLFSSAEYRSVVVAYRNGAPVRLSDVAQVIDGVENTKLAAWMNDKPAVIVNIQRQPGANIITVVDRIKLLLPQLRASLPSSVNVTILTDRTVTIRASVADVQFSLVLTIALVVHGDVPVPAEPGRHRHPQRRRAHLAGRRVRHHVPPGLQPRQPLADGADHLHRLRGRRRHRDDREHRALHRGGRVAAARRAQGLRADRLHHRVADRLAHRRAHPAPVHGRHRGPALPRVRHHAERDDPGVGGGVPDPDADDVRPAPRPRPRAEARPVLPR